MSLEQNILRSCASLPTQGQYNILVGCKCTYTISVGDVMSVLDSFVCSVGVSLGLCFFFFFLDFCNFRMIDGFISVIVVFKCFFFVTEVVYVPCIHDFLIHFFVSEM